MTFDWRNNRPKMFLQPRSGDKNIVVNALGYFDGFHIGASIPASLVNFVQDVGKPFFIDPMTYKFTSPPEYVLDKKENTPPPWMSTLAKRYSPVLEKHLGKKAITSDDLDISKEILEELTVNSLDYQRLKFRPSELSLINKYYDKYDAFQIDGEPIPHSIQGTSPELLVPPFFLTDTVGDPWYKINLTCAHIAVENKKPEELLYGVIFLSKEALLSSEFIKIIDDYSDQRFGGVALWINGLDEESASSEVLSNLLQLIEGFRLIGKVVVKLNGGYLSILMSNNGLSGFSCGLSYRSSRDINASKWIRPGPPKSKFYIPGLHQAYPLEEAEHLLKTFSFLKCACAVCKNSYGHDLDKFSSEMKKDGYCQNHFLNSRKSELDTFAKQGISGTIDEVNEILHGLKKKNARGARHLTRWRNLLIGVKSVGVGKDLLAKVKEIESTFPLQV